MRRLRKIETKKIVLLGILTAIVIMLQILAIMMRPLFPAFTITLVLIPIIIGAALIGEIAGLWLGFAFGLAVLISGDATAFLAINPAGTIFTVLLKGSLAGFSAGFMYRLLADINKTIAAITAAIICPLVNTGIFIVCSYLLFLESITQWGMDQGFISATTYIFVSMIGINFLIELGINLLLCPVIIRLIQHGKKTGLN